MEKLPLTMSLLNTDEAKRFLFQTIWSDFRTPQLCPSRLPCDSRPSWLHRLSTVLYDIHHFLCTCWGLSVAVCKALDLSLGNISFQAMYQLANHAAGWNMSTFLFCSLQLGICSPRYVIWRFSWQIFTFLQKDTRHPYYNTMRTIMFGRVFTSDLF